MRIEGLISATMLALVGNVLAAQNADTLDLAAIARKDTMMVNPGIHRFILTGMLPGSKYTYTVFEGMESRQPIGPISLPGGGMLAVTPCDNLKAANKALMMGKKEEEIAALLRNLKAAVDSPGLDQGCEQPRHDADSLREKTTTIISNAYNIKAGHYVLIRVVRRDTADKPEREWELRITTGPDGEWRTTYGYNFPMFVRWSGGRTVKEGKQYFSKQVGDTGSLFVVSEESDRQHFDAVPSVMFSYMPARERGFLIPSLTAGFGADLEKVQTFVGLAFTYKDNLVLNVGGSFGKEKVLSQYSLGDTVKTNLTTDQLMTDAFRLRPFVGVTIRFDKNPFKKGTEEAEPAAKAPPTGDSVDKKGGGL